jgi:ribonuclease HI
MSVKGFLDKYFGKEVEQMVEEKRTPKVTPFIQPKVEVATPRTFHIFTDGACSDNGKRTAKGAFGVHFYSKKGSGLDISCPLMMNEPQTNNRGELRAIQAALDAIERYESLWSKDYDEYCIWSDSEYSIHCLTKWASGWRRNGWKKSDGGIIQNIDLIRPIYEKLGRMSRIRLQHVRAHQRGRENEFPFDGNTEADRLARQAVLTNSLR